MTFADDIFYLLQNTQDRNLKPIFIYDLDDTLIDCRHRKFKVIQDFLKTYQDHEESKVHRAKLSKLLYHQIQYRIADTLKVLEIDDPDFEASLYQFWQLHNFSHPYVLQDKSFPGAVEFVRRWSERGVFSIYLTGRDLPGMGAATFASIESLGFPVSKDVAAFMLKPSSRENDLQFKIDSLEAIAEQGKVAAAFENELANLNAMSDRFPDALMYWRKTLYSPNQPIPRPKIRTLLDFEQLSENQVHL